jgi:DNA-binding CsgD family transcriptional regulator
VRQRARLRKREVQLDAEIFKLCMEIQSELFGAAVSLLSPAEFRVYELVRVGRANKEIGSALNISERTVKFHVSAMLAKFGVAKRQELQRNEIVSISSMENVVPIQGKKAG